MNDEVASEDRVIQLGPGLAAIPERLLLAHARGEVLFICGAGISRPAGLPDFRQLVLDIYAQLDASTHSVSMAETKCASWRSNSVPVWLVEKGLKALVLFSCAACIEARGA